jgi:DNA-binding beta-propeller fold protein YncE
MRILIFLFALATLTCAQTNQLLHLEKTIELPDVEGRIDHMSIDTGTGRLFVSALGNETVEVIDIKAGKRVKTIPNLAEPQGVLFVADTNRLYVANDKDGTVKIFDAKSYTPLKTLNFGDDADNLRYDPVHKHIFVGYGSGALGEIDAAGNEVADVRLDAHPESFQIEKSGPHVYVNLPGSRKIAVIDREKHSVITTWKTDNAFANFPLALDEPDHRLFVVTRAPARLLVFDTHNGTIIQELPAVGDCDDVFFDQRRKRIYASGGDGEIFVFAQQDPDHYAQAARIPTVKGARTSFFSPDLDRLFLATRRQGSRSAAIQVFAPAQ